MPQKDWRDRVMGEPSTVDMDAVTGIAKEAGRMGQDWFLEHLLDWDGMSTMKHVVPFVAKEDGSMVTEADKLLNGFITEKLKALTPDIPVVSEEAPASENLTAMRQGQGTYWCVDPIDGTSNFVGGKPGWGVLIGLVEHGAPTQGVAFYPELEQLYYTKDGKAFMEAEGKTTPLHTIARGTNETIRVGEHLRDTHPAFDAAFMKVKTHKELFATGSALPPQPELGVARGDIDVTFRPLRPAVQTPKLWDVAGPMAILQAAGGIAQAHDGAGGNLAPMDFVTPLPDFLTPPFIAGNAQTLKNHALIGHAVEIGAAAGNAQQR